MIFRDRKNAVRSGAHAGSEITAGPTPTHHPPPPPSEAPDLDRLTVQKSGDRALLALAAALSSLALAAGSLAVPRMAIEGDRQLRDRIVLLSVGGVGFGKWPVARGD
ncbi:hypothetical protein [Streptomyces sp. NPDC040750]|uniref:hypothetical protein n=1 Tax=Streptomyces sp. NPDC040750 TaxID=3154491 RepID=UPI0034060995